MSPPGRKTVLVRYSNPYGYRGLKALSAERYGVKAMLICSGPAAALEPVLREAVDRATVAALPR